MTSSSQSVQKPLYSPVPVETVENAIIGSSVSESVIPTVVDALDELQLSLVSPSSMVPDDVWARSEETQHLCVDEYPGVHGNPFSHLLFLTGEIAQAYFEAGLPALSDFERSGVRLALSRYTNYLGFNVSYDPMITPIPMRTVPYEELLMAEPGGFCPPLPTERLRKQQAEFVEKEATQ